MGKFEEIPIDKIEIGSRIRKEHKKTEMYAKYISLIGLLHPIIVRSRGNGTFLLLAGLGRFKAHELLGKDKIMAHILDEDEK